MAIFDETDWEAQDQQIRRAMMRDALTGDPDEEYIDGMLNSFNDYMEASVSSSLSSGGSSGSSAGARLLKNYALGSIASANAFNGTPADDEWDTGENTDIPTEITGSNIGELMVSNPKWNLQERRSGTYQYMQLMSSDFAIGQKLERWFNRDLPKMDPNEANAYARDLGADIKFDKPVSEFEVKQAADTYLKSKALENSLAQLNSTGSMGFYNDATVMAAGLAGGVGPAEFLTSVLLGWAIPEAAVAGLSNTGKVLPELLKMKKVADVAKEVKTAKTINTIAKGAASAAGSVERTAVGVILKNSMAGEKAAKIEARNIKAMQVLEKMQGLKYDKLTNLEKAGLDTLAFLGTDVPFINASRSNSEALGFDLYTEKDKAMDTLLAAGLGIFLPAGVRSVGRALNISPTALLTRQLDNMEIDVNAKEALGEITSEEAVNARKAIADLRKDSVDMRSGIYKRPDDYFFEQADGIQKINVSDETLLAQRIYALNELMAGNRPKLSSFPEFESIMSHIDARVLGGLKTKSALEVFGSNLLREVSPNGNIRAKVSDETGLLGSRYVTGTNEEETLRHLEELYKGMVLRDGQSAQAFKEWANSYIEFSRSLDDIYARVRSQIDANRLAKKEKSTALGASELVDVRKEMQKAYLDYKVGKQTSQEIRDALEENRKNRALGFSDQELPDEANKVLDEFEEWYSRYVSEKASKNGGILYDFIDKEGKVDYGATFSQYLDELKHGAEDNAYLAQADDTISMWSQAKINNIVESAIKLDVSPDTDFEKLFGAPRQTFEELQDMTTARDKWRGILSLQRLEYNKVINGDAQKPAFDIVKKYSDVDPQMESQFNSAVRRISEIDDVRKEGFTELRTNVINKLRESEAFQKRITDVLQGSDINKAIEYILRDTLVEVLGESRIAKILGSTRDTVNTMVRFFRKEIELHPEKLEAFLNPEDLIERKEIPEWTGREKKIEAVAQKGVSLDALFDPLEKGLELELDRLELQLMHDVDLAVHKMQLMMDNPEIAAEVLTGGATQTIYTFDGSKRNVEYLTKTAGFYMNDLKNRLREMDSASVKGQTLLDYYRNPSNKDDIIQAFIAKKHGVTGLDNSDADRIAQTILDQEASFLSSFRKYGSNFSTPSSVVKRGKLQYADVAISDSDLAELTDRIGASIPNTANDVLNGIARVNALGEIKRGDRIVLPNEELVADIAKGIRDIRKAIIDINSISNPVYKKMAFWALRDFDLNWMFDRSATSKTALNDVRDALLTGSWGDIIGDDLQNFFDAVTAVKRIKTHLVGRELMSTDKGLLAHATSWVYRFKNSFDDIGAVMSGERSASLDALEGGIHFKDAEAELNAARLFGFDSIEEQLNSAYNMMFQAFYALENFGTKPVALVTDLINAYNRARTTDKGLATKIAKLASKRGASARPTEKYAITEGAKDSIMENVLLNCGLQNSSPSAVTRVLKATQSFLSASLLVKAGLKSLSDYSTIWEGFLTNGMVSGRGEAMALAGKAAVEIQRNKDIRDLVLGSAILQQSDILKKMSNDPGADIVSVSKNASWVDRYEAASRRYADFMMNDFAHLSDVTNSNKMSAAWGIQYAIGANSGKSYEELGQWFQDALLRESITKDDWEFLRTVAVKDINELINRYSDRKVKGEGYNIFVPLELARVTDDVFAKELARRGDLNVTPLKVQDFKREMISKAWNMVDTSADEMVSIPSNRVGNMLRGGKARNSGWGAILELATQFQSFGVALLYNTYGRRLANFAARETGVSIIDLFNPAVKLSEVNRAGVFFNLFGMFCSIAMAMLVVESAVGALSGNIQAPIGKDGKIHADNVTSAMLGALGAGGVVLDAALTGIEGSGQRGGGFAMQIAPSVSNVLRTGYRLSMPLTSSRIPDAQRGDAFAAAAAQELARFTGLRSAPIISLVYQDLVGAWLDSKARGGIGNYETYQRARERRGQVLMPWERNPQPIWEKLQ